MPALIENTQDVTVAPAATEPPTQTLVERISSMSAVQTGMETVSTFYSNAKTSYPTLSAHVETVQAKALPLIEKARPLVDPLVEKIDFQTLDAFGHKQLDLLEESARAFTGKREELADTIAASRKRAQDLAQDAVKTAHEKVGEVIAATETALDKYLPEEDEEVEDFQDAKEEKEVIEGGDSAYGRVVQLSSKVKRRLHSTAMAKMGSAKMRSQQTLQSMQFSVDLIQYAQDNLDRSAGALREHLAQTQELVNASLEQGKKAAEPYIEQGKKVAEQGMKVAEPYIEQGKKVAEPYTVAAKQALERSREMAQKITADAVEVSKTVAVRARALSLENLPEPVAAQVKSALATLATLQEKVAAVDMESEETPLTMRRVRMAHDLAVDALKQLSQFKEMAASYVQSTTKAAVVEEAKTEETPLVAEAEGEGEEASRKIFRVGDETDEEESAPNNTPASMD